MRKAIGIVIIRLQYVSNVVGLSSSAINGPSSETLADTIL
jgi:hypothetical protein